MTRYRATVIGLSIAILMAPPCPVEARGGHGFGHGFGGHGMHGGFGGMRSVPFAGDRGHGNDAYIKAASEERDKLLNTKLKSICRGC